MEGNTKNLSRIMIGGGGTGGHVYPALAIADEIKRQYPDAEVYFVGALGRMEMEKVPKAGYPITGLKISGINRSSPLSNIKLPGQLFSAFRKVRNLLKQHNPQAVVGVGGYASGPLLYMAGRRGIPSLIQEQNSFPGLTNKWLAKKANKICVAYPGMDKYFSKDKIVFTGNPLRDFKEAGPDAKAHAYQFFGLNKNKPVVFLTGGSLGASAMNKAILELLPFFRKNEIQLIWQTGKFYFTAMEDAAASHRWEGLYMQPFIDKMPWAYAIADVVVSRAGAITLSELALLGKASVFIPSPNVAEDHQTKNANVLADAGAAAMVKETELPAALQEKILEILNNKELRQQLEKNMAAFARPNAAKEIVHELVKISLAS